MRGVGATGEWRQGSRPSHLEPEKERARRNRRYPDSQLHRYGETSAARPGVWHLSLAARDGSLVRPEMAAG